MAKALLGHLGGPHPQTLADLDRLRRRVRDLENEILRLRAENDALAAHTDPDRLVAADIATDLDAPQPALA